VAAEIALPLLAAQHPGHVRVDEASALRAPVMMYVHQADAARRRETQTHTETETHTETGTPKFLIKLYKQITLYLHRNQQSNERTFITLHTAENMNIHLELLLLLLTVWGPTPPPPQKRRQTPPKECPFRHFPGGRKGLHEPQKAEMWQCAMFWWWEERRLTS
jgi:hypothetical protein